jgi:hypothetical protein
VCYRRQAAPTRTDSVLTMADETKILSVELDGADGLIVKFSDGTTDGFLVEELLKLRPCREPLEGPVKSV